MVIRYDYSCIYYILSIIRTEQLYCVVRPLCGYIGVAVCEAVLRSKLSMGVDRPHSGSSQKVKLPLLIEQGELLIITTNNHSKRYTPH